MNQSSGDTAKKWLGICKIWRYSTTRKWQTKNYSYYLKRRNIIRVTLLPFGRQLAMDARQKRTTITAFLWPAKLFALLGCYRHWLKKIDTNLNRTYQLKLLNNNERMNIMKYLRKNSTTNSANEAIHQELFDNLIFTPKH
jgi:hypothetical protein